MRIRLPRWRPVSTRVFAFLFIFLGLLAYCYYYAAPYVKPARRTFEVLQEKHPTPIHHTIKKDRPLPDQCPIVMEASADIDTTLIYQTFDFQPSWLRTKEFWDKWFEDRYEQLKSDEQRFPLKVIVVPHSHNDPGWLKTFEQYFEWRSKRILNNVVQKLTQLPNMTFIWTEISFLSAWWERSHPVKRKALRKLVKEGRLEITTGGWVMPDEACTHIYALIDQFIEGHHWVKTNLDISPETGWSIDPFGHGPTVPYILDKSGVVGTIIQRIHYAWKEWLARRQIEEFLWVPGWRTNHRPSLIVHNQPFDIYSIKGSCGPHPAVCLGFDFRRIPGEYSEYTDKFEEITEQNVERRSRALVEQYARAGSLTMHNVVLIPLGDDFRYDRAEEFDSQYANYAKMFRYIAEHPDQFHADVTFGTPRDYFAAVQRRLRDLPSLKGDFFVYSDIFTEGKPAYWSGYFTTRPYLKILARQFEHQLRSAEILFTLVYNHLKRGKNDRLERTLETHYERLIDARRSLGLFQHHDAITGTSRASVMADYGLKLFNHMYNCVRLQEAALTMTMVLGGGTEAKGTLQGEAVWDTYGRPAHRLQVTFADKRRVVLFNPLAEPRKEVVALRSDTADVRVFDTRLQLHVPYQIAPVIAVQRDGRRAISVADFELAFEAVLPALSAVTFDLQEHTNVSNHCVVFCDDCSDFQPSSQGPFAIESMLPGDIQIENSYMKLVIDRNSGFLRQVYRKDARKRNTVEIQFGAYQSAQRHSGAYLFMPDYDAPEKAVLGGVEGDGEGEGQRGRVLVVTGPLRTEISVSYLPLLKHSLRLYHGSDLNLARGLHLETAVDFESPPKNRDTELFVRLQTDLQNGNPPEFFTDQNGFQYQKRIKVDKLGIAANYYPITTMAWMQDEETRVTLVTDHAQGAAAFEPGRLEVMLDRRTLYDDYRGVGEGVLDNRPTTFRHWLLVEEMSFESDSSTLYALPTQTADALSRALNYPLNVYLMDESETDGSPVPLRAHHAFAQNFPDGIHLLTLRTVPHAVLDRAPSTTALLVLQRPGYSCDVGGEARSKDYTFTRQTAFDEPITNITAVSLTGLHTLSVLKGFHDICLEPLEVSTFQIDF